MKPKRDRYVTAKCPECGRFMKKIKEHGDPHNNGQMKWVCTNPKCKGA